MSHSHGHGLIRHEVMQYDYYDIMQNLPQTGSIRWHLSLEDKYPEWHNQPITHKFVVQVWGQDTSFIHRMQPAPSSKFYTNLYLIILPPVMIKYTMKNLSLILKKYIFENGQTMRLIVLGIFEKKIFFKYDA